MLVMWLIGDNMLLKYLLEVKNISACIFATGNFFFAKISNINSNPS